MNEIIPIRNGERHQIDIVEHDFRKLVRFSSFVDGHFADETLVPIEEFAHIAENKPSKNIVFLDIDGVMTSVENGTSFLCENEKDYKIDPYCRIWMERLWTDIPDLKVVISSAWCNRGELTDHSPIWPWKNIPMHSPLPSLYHWLVENNKYYGKLDNRCKKNGGIHVSKYQKILDWWTDNGDKRYIDTKVLVLDDDASDYNELTKIDSRDGGKRWHFQQVDYKHGFNADECAKALAFFRQ